MKTPYQVQILVHQTLGHLIFSVTLIHNEGQIGSNTAMVISLPFSHLKSNNVFKFKL